MNRFQRAGLVTVVLGFGLVILGLAFIPDPIGSYLVIVLGLLTTATGATYTLRRLTGEPARWRPDDPESGLRFPAPGAELDELPADEFTRRLRGHVVRALIETGYSRAEAEAMVADGSWTDDRYAGAYLGGEALRNSLAIRIRTIGRGDPVTRGAQERVIEELRRLREGRT